MSYVNLDCPPPDGLHRQRDEAGDRVRQGQVVDKVMDIGTDPGVIRTYIIYDFVDKSTRMHQYLSFNFQINMQDASHLSRIFGLYKLYNLVL